MTYNKEFTREVGNLVFKLYELKNTEWGKPSHKRYFVEVWDKEITVSKGDLPQSVAIVEKREYKSRNAAMKRIRDGVKKTEEDGS